MDTSASAEVDAKENPFQYDNNVVEIDSKVFAMDSSVITMRKVGTNNEETLVKGEFVPGLVTDGKTLYYFDAKAKTINSLDVKSKKTKKIVKVEDHVEIDEYTSGDPTFARLDAVCGGYLYYQMCHNSDTEYPHYPNYVVNLKDGSVKKSDLTNYGTYKFQPADGKIYFDHYRTGSYPTELMRATPDGSDKETLVQGITNFEVIGDRVYYYKCDIENMSADTCKIMYYDIKTAKHEVVREGLPYTIAGFTKFAAVSDRDLGGTYHTVIEHYDASGEVINGNGAMVSGDCIIVHSGVDESEDQQITETTNLDWLVITETLISKPVSVPAGAYPVSYKDGYLYYVFLSEGTKETLNRVVVEFEEPVE